MVTVDRVYGVDLWAIGALPLGLVLDLALGDPRWMPNPSRATGSLAERAEGGLRVAVARAGGTSGAEHLAGVVLATVVVGLVGGLAWSAVEVFDQLGGPATLIGRAILIYWGLSIGRLRDAISRASEAPDLETARRALGELIGLDSARLDEAGARRSCVEAIGERANDTVVAPLFWLAMAGPAGLLSYRAVETLSGIAHAGGARYRHFGRAWARLASLADFVPVRLTCLLIALSAALLREDGTSSLLIGSREGRRHPGRPDTWGLAALAGALGVQLGGRTTFGGIAGREPLVGEPRMLIDRTTVRRAVRIMRVAGLHAAALAWAFRIVVWHE